MQIKPFLVVVLFVSALILNLTHAEPEDLYPFTTSLESQRFAALIQEIRCVVCQNQNLADSNAPLAADLRQKIYKMVLAQQSDDEIKAYLTERYGDFILLKPYLNKTTLILWTFPLLGLLIASILIIQFKYKSLTRIPKEK